LVKNSKAGL